MTIKQTMKTYSLNIIRYELSKNKKLYAVYETPCTVANCGSNCNCKEYKKLINKPIIIK